MRGTLLLAQTEINRLRRNRRYFLFTVADECCLALMSQSRVALGRSRSCPRAGCRVPGSLGRAPRGGVLRSLPQAFRLSAPLAARDSRLRAAFTSRSVTRLHAWHL
jgi:hypothetical protein